MDYSLLLNRDALNTFFVVFFYVGIVLLVYLNRRKFEIQSGFIALYRTKFGIKLIERIGKRHKEFIKILGYISIGAGFIGMVFVTFYVTRNLYTLLTVPGAQSEVAPALPGVKVPGSPIYIPLIVGWVALFFVTIIHEFSHGVVAVAHDLKVKSTGVAFFGPIMGAFVEPDEKELVKRSDVAQYSIFAAGPFSNVLLALTALMVLFLVVGPVIDRISEPVGFTFDGVSKGLPAEAAGISPSRVFTSVNGDSVINDSMFLEVMKGSVPNQKIILGTKDRSYEIITTVHPENKERGYVGVTGVRTSFELSKRFGLLGFAYPVFLKIAEVIMWIYILSFGIGIVNLLPLGPIDGGRMLQVSLVKTQGKKKGLKLWTKISAIVLVILLLNIILSIFLPLLSWVKNIF